MRITAKVHHDVKVVRCTVATKAVFVQGTLEIVDVGHAHNAAWNWQGTASTKSHSLQVWARVDLHTELA